MKLRITHFLVSCLFIPFLILSACSSPSPEEPEPTLTETEKQQLDEQMAVQGGCNVDTLDKASYLAGFTVVIPAYIPEGFYHRSNIIVTQLGGGLPEGMKPKFTANIVQITYYSPDDDSVGLMLQQTRHKIGLGGGKPTEICGRPAEKAYQEANLQRKYPGPVLTLGWENDGTYYQITGTMAAPLDEAMLEKIACSVGAD